MLPSNSGFDFMRILFIGDIFGRPGRNIVKDRLPGIVRDHAINLIIANGENSAAGFGITPALAEELFELNIDVITTGNHVWDKREIIDYFQMVEGNGHGPARRVLRPANYPRTCRSALRGIRRKFLTRINLQNRVFMASNDDPFRTADQLLKRFRRGHSGGYSRRRLRKISPDGISMGGHRWWARIRMYRPRTNEFCRGTAYVTDGYDRALRWRDWRKRFGGGKSEWNARSIRARLGRCGLCAVVIDCDEATGKAAD